MPARSTVISGATVALFALVDDIDGPVPLEIVEQFSVNESTATERITGVGDSRPVENVMHGTAGAEVSWGQVLKGDGDNLWANKILAEARAVPTHKPIDLMAVDLNTSRTIMIIHTVLPQNIGVSFSPQASVRANVSFTATHVTWPTEIN